MDVLIRGDGVAAYCCAYLLTKAGFRVDLQPVDRPRLPVIMLGDQALALIRDIFDQPGLFADLPRIRKRVVAWGPGAKPVALEHSAVVVSEELLSQSIRPALVPNGDLATLDDFRRAASSRRGGPTLLWLAHGVRSARDAEGRLRSRRLLDRIARKTAGCFWCLAGSWRWERQPKRCSPRSRVVAPEIANMRLRARASSRPTRESRRRSAASRLAGLRDSGHGLRSNLRRRNRARHP